MTLNIGDRLRFLGFGGRSDQDGYGLKVGDIVTVAEESSLQLEGEISVEVPRDPGNKWFLNEVEGFEWERVTDDASDSD